MELTIKHVYLFVRVVCSDLHLVILFTGVCGVTWATMSPLFYFKLERSGGVLRWRHFCTTGSHLNLLFSMGGHLDFTCYILPPIFSIISLACGILFSSMNKNFFFIFHTSFLWRPFFFKRNDTVGFSVQNAITAFSMILHILRH